MLFQHQLHRGCDFVSVAKKSLLELKQLYLRMKSEVFGGGILKIVHNSESLDRLLKKVFGTQLLSQSDVSDPK